MVKLDEYLKWNFALSKCCLSEFNTCMTMSVVVGSPA